MPAEAKVLLFVGRLNQEKRPLLAYELFSRLCRQRDDVWLVMVGDGPQRQELARRALADGLAGRLILTGLLPYAQMPAVYNAAHLWLSTSQSEVQPMVALEAIACGLPAVVYVDSALQGVVEHDVNGFVVDDDEGFLRCLHHLLDTPERYQAMRRAALRQGEQYSVGRTAASVLHLYHEVLSNWRPSTQGARDYLHRRFSGLPKQKRV
jgi:1,2-diacylglycerol 3-alpha-glucosyltransferase